MDTILNTVLKSDNYFMGLFNYNISILKNQVYVAGHSMGGAISIGLAQRDKRITGGAISLDPYFRFLTENYFEQTVNVPVLIIAMEKFLNSEELDPSKYGINKLSK